MTWVALWLCIATDDDDNDRRLKWNRHAMACRGPNRISAHAYIYSYIHTTYIHMYVHHTESIRHRHSHLKTERLSSRVLDGNPRAQTNIHIISICMYVHICTYVCTYVYTDDSLSLHLKFGCYFPNDFVPMASIARKCRRGKIYEWLQEIPFPLLVSIGWNKSMTCHCQYFLEK